MLHIHTDALPPPPLCFFQPSVVSVCLSLHCMLPTIPLRSLRALLCIAWREPVGWRLDSDQWHAVSVRRRTSFTNNRRHWAGHIYRKSLALERDRRIRGKDPWDETGTKGSFSAWTCQSDQLQTLSLRPPDPPPSMSTPEEAGQREEGEYGRAAKRLKTEETEADEREEGEEELEEGEDSDSGSLPGNGESATDNRARWSASQFGAGLRVRRAKMLPNGTLRHSITHRAGRAARMCARAVMQSVPRDIYLSHICRRRHHRHSGAWAINPGQFFNVTPVFIQPKQLSDKMCVVVNVQNVPFDFWCWIFGSFHSMVSVVYLCISLQCCGFLSGHWLFSTNHRLVNVSHTKLRSLNLGLTQMSWFLFGYSPSVSCIC